MNIKGKKKKVITFISILLVFMIFNTFIYQTIFADTADTRYVSEEGYFYIKVYDNSNDNLLAEYKVDCSIKDATGINYYVNPQKFEKVGGTEDILSLSGTPITSTDGGIGIDGATEGQRQYILNFTFNINSDKYGFYGTTNDEGINNRMRIDNISSKSNTSSCAPVNEDGSTFTLSVGTNDIGMTNWADEVYDGSGAFYHATYKIYLDLREYTQTVWVSYQNADGTTYTEELAVINNEKYAYGETVSWNRPADEVYEAASVNYTVTGDTETHIQVKRRTYKVNCVDIVGEDINNVLPGTQSAKDYLAASEAKGSDWGTDNIHPGYTYSGCTSVSDKNLLRDNITVYRKYSPKEYTYTVNYYIGSSNNTSLNTWVLNNTKTVTLNVTDNDKGNKVTISELRDEDDSTYRDYEYQGVYVTNTSNITDADNPETKSKEINEVTIGNDTVINLYYMIKTASQNTENLTINMNGGTATVENVNFNSSKTSNTYTTLGAIDTGDTKEYDTAGDYTLDDLHNGNYTITVAGAAGGSVQKGDYLAKWSDGGSFLDFELVTTVAGGRGSVLKYDDVNLNTDNELNITVGAKGEDATGATAYYDRNWQNFAYVDGHAFMATANGTAYLYFAGYGGKASSVSWTSGEKKTTVYGGGGTGGIAGILTGITDFDTGVKTKTGINADDGRLYSYLDSGTGVNSLTNAITQSDSTNYIPTNALYETIANLCFIPEYNLDKGMGPGFNEDSDRNILSTKTSNNFLAGGLYDDLYEKNVSKLIGSGINGATLSLPGISGYQINKAKYIMSSFTGVNSSDNGYVNVHCNYKNITLPEPTREGYTFKGYKVTYDVTYDGEKKGKITYENGDEIADGTIIQPCTIRKYAGNVTITAIWERKTYTVVYTRGATDIVAPDFIETDWIIDVPHCVAYNSFIGRNYTINFDTTSYLPKKSNGETTKSVPTIVNSITGNLQFKNWEVLLSCTSKIVGDTYNQGESATNLTSAGTTATLEAQWYQETIDFSDKVPALYGYIFKGWKLNNTDSYRTQTLVGCDDEQFSETYYATWEPVKVKIIYDYNAGSYITVDGRRTWVESSTKDLIAGCGANYTNYKSYKDESVIGSYTI